MPTQPPARPETPRRPTVTTATYLDARKGLLIDCRRYRRYALAEPQRTAHFMAWRKAMQRHLAHLRFCTKHPARLCA